jgi:hypothetical protein
VLNANTSTWFRKTTTDRGQNAARDGGGAIDGSRNFKNPRFKALQLKRIAWGGREEDGELTNLLTKAI